MDIIAKTRLPVLTESRETRFFLENRVSAVRSTLPQKPGISEDTGFLNNLGRSPRMAQSVPP
jgi:hypothetical protein